MSDRPTRTVCRSAAVDGQVFTRGIDAQDRLCDVCLHSPLHRVSNAINTLLQVSDHTFEHNEQGMEKHAAQRRFLE